MKSVTLETTYIGPPHQLYRHIKSVKDMLWRNGFLYLGHRTDTEKRIIRVVVEFIDPD